MPGKRRSNMPGKRRSNEEIVHALPKSRRLPRRRSGPSPQEGRGGLPPAGRQRADVLPLEEKVRRTAGVQEVRELRSQRHENAKLKQLVADLTLDRHILQEIVRKKI